jgi:hypothetical protein
MMMLYVHVFTCSPAINSIFDVTRGTRSPALSTGGVADKNVLHDVMQRDVMWA